MPIAGRLVVRRSETTGVRSQSEGRGFGSEAAGGADELISGVGTQCLAGSSTFLSGALAGLGFEGEEGALGVFGEGAGFTNVIEEETEGDGATVGIGC